MACCHLLGRSCEAASFDREIWRILHEAQEHIRENLGHFAKRKSDQKKKLNAMFVWISVLV